MSRKNFSFVSCLGLAAFLTAVPSYALELAGTIFKSNKQETINFDLNLTAPNASYEIKGGTSTDQGIFYSSDLDFSFVRVTKKAHTIDGRYLFKSYPNSGKMTVYLRDRTVDGMILAGIPLSGKITQGYWIDDVIEFSNLTVKGTKASGCLDYNAWNGHYNVGSDCQFGGCKITGDKNQACVMDYDTWGKNSMPISMKFGNLIITGRINFADTKEIEKSGKSTKETVVSTLGTIGFIIKKDDGSEPVISSEVSPKDGQLAESADEENLRKFLAFFQLIAFDTFAE